MADIDHKKVLPRLSALIFQLATTALALPRLDNLAPEQQRSLGLLAFAIYANYCRGLLCSHKTVNLVAGVQHHQTSKRMVDQLKAAGYVEVKQSPRDKRVYYLCPTYRLLDDVDAVLIRYVPFFDLAKAETGRASLWNLTFPSDTTASWQGLAQATSPPSLDPLAAGFKHPILLWSDDPIDKQEAVRALNRYIDDLSITVALLPHAKPAIVERYKCHILGADKAAALADIKLYENLPAALRNDAELLFMQSSLRILDGIEQETNATEPSRKKSPRKS